MPLKSCLDFSCQRSLSFFLESTWQPARKSLTTLAEVWVSPGASGALGDPPLGRVDGVLGEGTPPWATEIDFKVFYVAPPVPGSGRASCAVRGTRAALRESN